MKKKLRIGGTCCLCAALIAAFLLSGCGSKKAETTTDSLSKSTESELEANEKTALEKVTLNEVAHSIFYAPMYAAIELGYFEEAGIELDLVTGFGADKTMTALLSGEADIGFMGPETTVYTYNEGASDVVKNFAQLTQRAGNFLVARDAMPDFKWEDLKGKTVLGGRAGGMPEMIFEYVLKQNGLDPKTDLTIDQSIDFGSTAAAFSGGQGDYTCEFEPGATMLEQEKAGAVVASLGVESGYVPYTAFSAKESYIKANPDTIRFFVGALKKGIEYVENHTPEEIAATIAPQFSETETQTIASIVERYEQQDTWKTTLVFEKDGFDLLLTILEQAGQLTDRPDYDALVTTEFVTK